VPKILQKILKLPSKLGVALITLYQKTISPDHSWLRHMFPGGYCRYTPTCSQYTKMSIEKHGLIWGSLKGAWRVLRCNPFSKGGMDLP
jgi:putative membrane protein insertion efficiency factor